jgi:hypothetical protein
MFRVVAGMSFMTGTTGSAFITLINMLEMEVILAISEICQRIGLRVLYDCFFMAFKAEIVIFDIEGHVKFRWILCSQ